MTDYEIADLIVSHVETVLAFFVAFVSLTSAFLVAAYFGQGKLTPLLVRLIAGLYTLGSLFLIFVSQRLTTIIQGIRTQLPESMNWHPSYFEPQWFMPFINNFLVLALFVTYFSAMWYLFSTQRSDRAEDDT